MKRRLLIGAMLLISVRVLAIGEGYVAPPEDAAILPISVTGTSYEQLELGVRGGTLNVARSSDPKGWNAHTAHETSTTWFTDRMNRGLLSVEPVRGAIVPSLAKSYEISEDGLVLTFHLREGIRWSDGIPITADDVLFTYNDIVLNEDVDCNWRDAQILPDGTFPICEKVDDYTVTFTLSTTYRPILNSLVFGIMPEHKLAQHVHKCNPNVPAGTFNEAWTLDTPLDELVGNGPWVVTDYRANVSVTMERNPYYYAYDSEGTQLPYYDRIIVHIVKNEDVSSLKFRNGEIDVYALRPEDIPFLLPESANKDFTVMITDMATYGTSWILVNQDIGLAEGTDAEKRELYRNVKFREALAHLLDKETMIRNVLNGMGAAQWSPVSVPSPFYAGRNEYGGPITEEDAVVFEYDQALAASMLDALGVVDQDGDGWRDLPSGAPLAIEINTSDNTLMGGVCAIYQADLRAVGLDADFRVIDFNTLVTRIMMSTCDLIALGLSGGDEPNDGKNVYSSCGALHAYRYSACAEPDEADLRIDSLLDLGANTCDLDAAFEYYKEYQLLVAQQLGYMYSVVRTFIYAYYNYVGNASASSPISYADGPLAEMCFDRRLK